MTQQNSANLALPYIQPAQAQKHVTHNEAIRVLDALVQPVVVEPPLNTPPETAAEGARYLIGTAPTGAWIDHAGDIAWRTDGNWSYLTPQPGWSMRAASTGTVYAWIGGVWLADTGGGATPTSLPMLGLNTTADDTNRLSVVSDATLLNHDGSGHQVKVNKSADTDTASLLFQTGFSGRAEMGTAGSDSFAIKVSADGVAWSTALQLDATNGTASFPSGARVTQRLNLSGRITCETGRWMTASGVSDDDAGTGAEPTIDWRHAGPFITAGTTLGQLTLALRSESPEVTGLDLRAVLHTGPWDSGWATDADTTRTAVATLDGLDISGGQTRATLDLGGTTATEDSYFVLYARPIGTTTEIRFVVASMALTLTA